MFKNNAKINFKKSINLLNRQENLRISAFSNAQSGQVLFANLTYPVTLYICIN